MRQVHGLSEDGETIVLRRFSGGVACDPGRGDDRLKRMLVVDVETTGLDPKTDRVIEFAAADVSCTEDGRVTQHHGTYSWLQDPGRPIPPEVTAITGITDADVAGQAIPVQAEELLADADFVVSHNASFDHPFCRKRWPDTVDQKVWACSWRQVEWERWGFGVHKQDILARFHGFFYDAHRAEIDVEALVKLLQMRPEPEADRYLSQLQSYVREGSYRLLAVGTPYSAKDELKQRGYSWDSERRVWWTTVRTSEFDDTRQWLEDLYERYGCRSKPVIQKIDPRQQWA
jgi:DNA polymerase-3 subunit epsilon